MTELAGRKILVTGASRGLGAALSAWMIGRGAEVLCVGRSRASFPQAKAARLVDELGGLDACTKYELMAKEIDWNFYSGSFGAIDSLRHPSILKIFVDVTFEFFF